MIRSVINHPSRRGLEWTETESSYCVSGGRRCSLGLEDLTQHSASHAAWCRNAVQIENCWRDIEYAYYKTHQTHIFFDVRPHRNKRPRHIITICEVVFSNNRRVPAVVVAQKAAPEGFLKFPQRFDSMIGDDEQISVRVYVLQDCSEYPV